ncbi:arginine ABC transporter permease ArtQ [Aeromonas rivipollensis]|jgi:arginine transport system permease protein|uniref:Arginine ABC transporter permease ArtQ n=1 Tax=Aeromonas media TaxID=651 RepID=A0A6M4Y672_AERME|nr:MULTISPECIES: arginine ABC transporter permease ArtQ [Aeromonas]MCE9923844.1 arginine ABC transporter permease ArtQ [Aeromonas media]MDM5086320.1 arginine ABC transporter permease ArtQ [Aeromonas rivipollensis]MDM5098839.1 arginine ABC transporter permease ArtQ [Aeromonas rivipollensis]MDM5107198.1 arginine ABC transporter permease ArtQ [Aeromonas rivipollensis]QJT20590.1 arginine ABC transporter permease ArtQ [Aeromonas media]
MLSLLLDAAWMTLGLALASLVGGMALALAFSAAELSKRSWLVWPVATLTTLIRGLPELLVVLFIYFGSTQVLFLITGEYVEFSPFACGVLALSLLFASYATQTLRAALNAVPAGQRLAALALGLGKSHIFFRIVLPQAWRHALPGLGNQWLVLLKDTALVSLIGVNEMMRQAQMASASTYEPFTWYAAAALIYLAISLVSEFGLKQAANYTRRYGG